MRRLSYLSVDENNEDSVASFLALMIPYVHELEGHKDQPYTPEDLLANYAHSMVKRLGSKDRVSELCCSNGKPIGFYYAKIDRLGDKGFIKPGYGFIMEFYVMPENRRSGFGREICVRMEQLLANMGASRLYLTADLVTGISFWEASGYQATGEQSPDNQQPIYEKQLSTTGGEDMAKV